LHLRVISVKDVKEFLARLLYRGLWGSWNPVRSAPPPVAGVWNHTGASKNWEFNAGIWRVVGRSVCNKCIGACMRHQTVHIFLDYILASEAKLKGMMTYKQVMMLTADRLFSLSLHPVQNIHV
jgi:hypothetical protein